jgi:hypothetical protein
VRKVLDYLREMPTLALVTVAVGLIATAAAHVIQNLDLKESLDEYIEWEETGPIPDSREAPLGRRGRIQVTDATLAATRANASGYRVYRVAATLNLTTGAPERRSNSACTIGVPRDIIFARTPGGRAVFPQPSEDLEIQDVPDIAAIEFNAKGTDLVGLEVEDVIEEYTTTPEVLVEWGDYKPARQTFEWVIRGGDHEEPVNLTFAAMFRTTDAAPAATISCSATTVEGGEARTSTSGELR